MKILAKALLLAPLLFTSFAFAADAVTPQPITPTTVIVTEKIPGMDCVFMADTSVWSPDPNGESKSSPTNRKYECTIKPGFWSVMDILGGLIKYATFIVALIGVLMLVVSGIQYSLAGFDKESAGKAKGRIQKVLAGIVLLFLTGLILNTVAPWIYR